MAQRERQQLSGDFGTIDYGSFEQRNATINGQMHRVLGCLDFNRAALGHFHFPSAEANRRTAQISFAERTIFHRSSHSTNGQALPKL